MTSNRSLRRRPQPMRMPSQRTRRSGDQRSKQRKRRTMWAVLSVVLTVVAGGLATALAANNAAAAPNPNCSLVVPANPLTAQGLATPYQLVATNAAGGPCNEANAGQSAFVEAAILTNNGQLTLYDPLVIDQGTQPAAATVTPQVPAGSTVGIWFGFNGTNLTLQSANGANALQQGNCINGAQGSIFGQFSYCNAPTFFQTANQEIQANMLQVPAAGTAKDGQPCPTTRDFSVVDQDQSDNVVTHYVATGNGTIAQNNAASKAALQNQNLVDLANGSDNLLLTQFIDPALGCTPWTRPDQSSDGMASAALPLDELSAAANQQAPIALVPLTDPMTLNNANQDPNKTNLYRQGVDQAALGADAGSGTTYCQNFFGSPNGIQRVFKDMAIFQNAPSVDAAMATNLFTFLAMRANQSFTNLGCGGLLNVANPITLTMDGNGVVTAATFTPLGQTPVAAATCTATPAATTAAAAATTAAAPATTAAAATTAAGAGAATSAAAAGMAGAATTPAAGGVGAATSAAAGMATTPAAGVGAATSAAAAGGASTPAAVGTATSAAAAGAATTPAAAAATTAPAAGTATSTCIPAAASAPAAGTGAGATSAPASAMPTATVSGRGRHHHHHM
ncbi:hypothetical protein [Streptacidiphilus sp. EB103A]|uniref:hypothetical protein n=1 Tax=Streptacidiphilus sp. EB103A TaxID=3156275 RepID=UPI003513D64C